MNHTSNNYLVKLKGRVFKSTWKTRNLFSCFVVVLLCLWLIGFFISLLIILLHLRQLTTYNCTTSEFMVYSICMLFNSYVILFSFQFSFNCQFFFKSFLMLFFASVSTFNVCVYNRHVQYINKSALTCPCFISAVVMIDLQGVSPDR